VRALAGGDACYSLVAVESPTCSGHVPRRAMSEIDRIDRTIYGLRGRRNERRRGSIAIRTVRDPVACRIEIFRIRDLDENSLLIERCGPLPFRPNEALLFRPAGRMHGSLSDGALWTTRPRRLDQEWNAYVSIGTCAPGKRHTFAVWEGKRRPLRGGRDTGAVGTATGVRHRKILSGLASGQPTRWSCLRTHRRHPCLLAREVGKKTQPANR